MESPYQKAMLEREIKSSIHEERVLDISLWRVFRSYTRYDYLNRKSNIIASTAVMNSKILLLRNFALSISQFVRLMIKRPCKNYVCFAFPRLYEVDNSLIDRITDPLIESSILNEDTVIFNCLYDNYRPDKLPKNNIRLLLDACFIWSHILRYIILPFVYLKYGKNVRRVYNIAKDIFELDNSYYKTYLLLLSKFIALRRCARSIFKIIKPKMVFVVNYDNYLPFVSVAKDMKIKVAELQHGITIGDTPLYTGHYDPSLDPDLFLTFGSIWVGSQFGIPVDNVKNIGWSYSNYVKEKIKDVPVLDNHIMIVSSPDITKRIIEVAIHLAEHNKNLSFGIRLHPHEELSEEDMDRIKAFDNIYLVNKSIETQIALMSYHYVIGENSSVVYEALSLGCRVGRICMAGLSPDRMPGLTEDGFVYIYDNNDFRLFVKEEGVTDTANGYYSKYDNSYFQRIVIDSLAK